MSHITSGQKDFKQKKNKIIYNLAYKYAPNDCTFNNDLVKNNSYNCPWK